MTEWLTERGPEVRAIPIGDPPPQPPATVEDIEYAHRLRLELRERYPDRPVRRALAYWSVGID